MSEDRERRVKSAMRLWKKARINAFAHKIAMEHNRIKGRLLSTASIICGIGSIIAVLLTYIVFQQTPNQNTLPNKNLPELQEQHIDATIVLIATLFDNILPERVSTKRPALMKDYIALCLTLSSVFFSVLALIATIVDANGKYDVKANEHSFLQSMCLDIAQRCNPLKYDRAGLDDRAFDTTLHNLEEQFRLIKMRGSEPSDSKFHRAHKLLVERDKYLIEKPVLWLRLWRVVLKRFK